MPGFDWQLFWLQRLRMLRSGMPLDGKHFRRSRDAPTGTLVRVSAGKAARIDPTMVHASVKELLPL
jgi:hypothetical protein